MFSLSRFRRTSPATALHPFLLPDGGEQAHFLQPNVDLTDGWSLFFDVFDKFCFTSRPPLNNRLRPQCYFQAGASFDCVTFWSWKKKKKKSHVIFLWRFISWFHWSNLPECATCSISGITPTFSQPGTWSAFRICKKYGLLIFFFSFGDTWRRRSGCCSRFCVCVWLPSGRGGKTQALRQIKLPTDTSSESHYCPPDPSHHPPLPRNSLSAAPRTSLGGYFRSRKCWVTEGSTSSQQSGLKFNESLDAYFIVRRPPSITPYIPPAACLSSPFSCRHPPLVSVRHRPFQLWLTECKIDIIDLLQYTEIGGN